jgi:hypothetical protein
MHIHAPSTSTPGSLIEYTVYIAVIQRGPILVLTVADQPFQDNVDEETNQTDSSADIESGMCVYVCVCVCVCVV